MKWYMCSKKTKIFYGSIFVTKIRPRHIERSGVKIRSIEFYRIMSNVRVNRRKLVDSEVVTSLMSIDKGSVERGEYS